MQKEGKQEEGKILGGAEETCLMQSCARLLSLNGKYIFYFYF